MRLILFNILFILFIKLSAQRALGIYATANDFIQGRLSYESTKQNPFRIKLHELFNKSYITVKTKTSRIVLSKDSVFGYKDNQGVVYRYFKHQKYILLNPSEEILLYKQELKVGEAKYRQVAVFYFFSEKAGSPILPLSILNLETCFQNNKRFTEFLEIYFKNDLELSEYDYNHNMYKLNRLFELSTKSE
ncbi:MAG: hypothetical protein JNL60_06820 [Bacteroidia bacterium]|nr:hypothetical protein [Bacteroidia bacterium]